jgi:vacuolar protein sorting-associated protein 29
MYLFFIIFLFVFCFQVPGKMQHVLCTGNVCSKTSEEYLRTLANSVHIVRGDMDVSTQLSELPEMKTIHIGEFNIGLIHGHNVVPWGDVEALAQHQRQVIQTNINKQIALVSIHYFC